MRTREDIFEKIRDNGMWIRYIREYASYAAEQNLNARNSRVKI